MTSNACLVDVESSIPGRIRLRLPRGYRRHDVMSDISVTLNGTSGIRNVVINPATGSILVENDPDVINSDDLLDAIKVEPLESAISEAWSFLSEQPWPGISKTGTKIINNFKKFDQIVSWVTKGSVDGKLAIVIFLFALSLGRALFSDKRTAAPWHSLLWYSYSMFMQWHNPSSSKHTM